MFDRVLSVPWVLNMLGFEFAWVVNMPRLHWVLCLNCILKIHGILNVLSSEYAKVLNVAGVLYCINIYHLLDSTIYYAVFSSVVGVLDFRLWR